MARAKIDYAAMLSVYDSINKQRALTPQELDRVEYLAARLKRSQYEAEYRELHKERLAKLNKFYKQSPRSKQMVKKNHQRRYKDDPAYRKERHRMTANWRKNNPDKVRAKDNRKKEGALAARALDKGLKRAEKIAFWHKLATERQLNSFEQARLRYLERLNDPNSSTSISRREASKRYRTKNPGFSSESSKHWRETNPDRVEQANEKRKADRRAKINETTSIAAE